MGEKCRSSKSVFGHVFGGSGAVREEVPPDDFMFPIVISRKVENIFANNVLEECRALKVLQNSRRSRWSRWCTCRDDLTSKIWPFGFFLIFPDRQLIMFSLWYDVVGEVEHYQHTWHARTPSPSMTTFLQFLYGPFKCI